MVVAIWVILLCFVEMTLLRHMEGFFNHQYTSYLSKKGKGKWSEKLGEICATNAQMAFLDESTLWRINFKLQKEGRKDVNFFVRVRFCEDKGYEPPQGKIFVEDDISGVVKVNLLKLLVML